MSSSGKLYQRSCHSAEVLDKFVVEVAKSNEALAGARLLPILDDGDLVWICSNAFRVDGEAEILCLSNIEFALLDVALQICGSQSFQHLVNMLCVLQRGFEEDEDVGKVSCVEVVEVFHQSLLHVILASGGYVD